MCRQLIFAVSLVVLTAMVVAAEEQKAEEQKPESAAGAGTAIRLGPDDPKEKVKPGRVDEDAPQEFKSTKSGLRYRILRKGDKTKPAEADIVEVHYKGWFDDGTIFDSSYRTGNTVSFPLIRVIEGWTEGMQLVGKGGMIELEVPAKLGYGEKGKKGVVPPNTRLHFIIELIAVRQEFKFL